MTPEEFYAAWQERNKQRLAQQPPAEPLAGVTPEPKHDPSWGVYINPEFIATASDAGRANMLRERVEAAEKNKEVQEWAAKWGDPNAKSPRDIIFSAIQRSPRDNLPGLMRNVVEMREDLDRRQQNLSSLYIIGSSFNPFNYGSTDEAAAKADAVILAAETAARALPHPALRFAGPAYRYGKRWLGGVVDAFGIVKNRYVRNPAYAAAVTGTGIGYQASEEAYEERADVLRAAGEDYDPNAALVTDLLTVPAGAALFTFAIESAGRGIARSLRNTRTRKEADGTVVTEEIEPTFGDVDKTPSEIDVPADSGLGRAIEKNAPDAVTKTEDGMMKVRPENLPEGLKARTLRNHDIDTENARLRQEFDETFGAETTTTYKGETPVYTTSFDAVKVREHLSEAEVAVLREEGFVEKDGDFISPNGKRSVVLAAKQLRPDATIRSVRDAKEIIAGLPPDSVVDINLSAEHRDIMSQETPSARQRRSQELYWMSDRAQILARPDAQGKYSVEVGEVVVGEDNITRPTGVWKPIKDKDGKTVKFDSEAEAGQAMADFRLGKREEFKTKTVVRDPIVDDALDVIGPKSANVLRQVDDKTGMRAVPPKMVDNILNDSIVTGRSDAETATLLSGAAEAAKNSVPFEDVMTVMARSAEGGKKPVSAEVAAQVAKRRLEVRDEMRRVGINTGEAMSQRVGKSLRDEKVIDDLLANPEADAQEIITKNTIIVFNEKGKPQGIRVKRNEETVVVSADGKIAKTTDEGPAADLSDTVVRGMVDDGTIQQLFGKFISGRKRAVADTPEDAQMQELMSALIPEGKTFWKQNTDVVNVRGTDYEPNKVWVSDLNDDAVIIPDTDGSFVIRSRDEDSPIELDGERYKSVEEAQAAMNDFLNRTNPDGVAQAQGVRAAESVEIACNLGTS